MTKKARKETNPTKAQASPDAPRCSQCRKTVNDKNALDDCLECPQVVDACNDCIEDQMAEEHSEYDED